MHCTLVTFGDDMSSDFCVRVHTHVLPDGVKDFQLIRLKGMLSRMEW